MPIRQILLLLVNAVLGHDSAYLTKREKTPSLSFREHLRAVGGAIEE